MHIFIVLLTYYGVLTAINSSKMEILPKAETTNDLITGKCISKILHDDIDTFSVILYKNKLNYNNRFNHVIFLQINNLKLLKNLGRLQIYIFYLDILEDLTNVLNEIKAYDYWNSRAKYVIEFKEEFNLLEAMYICWTNNIYNVNILVNTSIYTFFPYEKGSCGNKIIPHHLSDCNNTTIKNFYPTKIPLNLNQCPMRLISLKRAPFVLDSSYPKHDPNKQGYEISLLKTIAERMNATIINVPHSYHEFGSLFPNGTATKMFGMLQKGQADLIVGGSFGAPDLNIYFDYSFSYGRHSSVWWVPTAGEIPKWQNLVKIFHNHLWILISITIIIQGIFCWAINCLKNTNNQSFFFHFFNSLSIYLQISVNYPEDKILKMSIFLWSLASLLIYSIYQSQLINALTNPFFEKQIKTMNDILSNLQYGYYDITARVFDPNIPTENLIAKYFVPCSLGMECVDRVAYKRDFAVMKNVKQIAYWIPRLYTDATGRKMIFGINEFLITTLTWVYTVRGFPLLDRMNKILMGLMENGLIHKWEEDMKFVVRKETSEDDHKPLSMNHLQTPFYILVFGLSLASMVFVYEVIVEKIKARKLKLRNT